MNNLPPAYVTYDSRRKIWVLMFEYLITLPPTPDRLGVRFKIPQHFQFDLASIPRIIWPVIGSFELSVVAPLIHDYLYAFEGEALHHRLLDPVGTMPVKDSALTRKEADLLFLELMLLEGIVSWKAKAAYHAVRMFGPRW